MIKQNRKLLDYADFVKYSPLYMESGTCNGNSIQRAIDAGFSRFKSVELSSEFFQEATDRFKGNNLIQIWQGHSTDIWPKMLERVTYPAVIFLDAHPAGPGTAGHTEFTEGDGRYGQDAIITRELEIILAHRNDHLIIIDDQNGLNSDNQKYMKMCLKANPEYIFEFWDENLSGDPAYYYEDKILVCRL